MSKAWGLSLGAGGIFGYAHIGAIKVLRAAGLSPDYISGTSAGALVGGLLAAGVDFGEAEREITALALDMGGVEIDQKSLRGIVPEGILEVFLHRLIGEIHLLDITPALSISCVDLVSGKIVVFTNRPPKQSLGKDRIYCSDSDLLTAIRGSVSLPGVFPPKRFKDWLLADGGIKDTVPVYEARRMGAQEVIAVDLTAHADKSREIKGIFSVLTRSFALAARSRTKIDLALYSSMVLTPETNEAGILSPSKIQKLVQSGMMEIQANLAEIQKLVGA